MNKTLSRGLMACLSLVALASCQDYDGGFSLDTIKKAEYAKHFEDTFGKIDPNQDWSMATLVKANVNLPGLTGTAKMNICTGDPRNSETRLLAQIMLKDGKGSIDFDAIKGSDNVFVTVEQDGEYKVFSQYALQNGMLNIGDITPEMLLAAAPLTRAFSGTCPTTQRTDDDATRDYTYFDNVKSTTNVVGIAYNSEEKTRDEWVAWTKDNVSWNSSTHTLTNNSPFTDASISSFVKVSSHDFSGFDESSMKSDVTSTTNENTTITFNGVTHTFEEWKSAVMTKYPTNPGNYNDNNTDYPFTVESILTKSEWGDYYDYTSKWNWSNPQYKDGADVTPAGTVYTYNGKTLSLEGWLADAENHLGDIVSGSYDGVWPNDELKSTMTFAPCESSEDGALLALTNESTWVTKADIENAYGLVCPTFQYLNNVEKSAATPLDMGAFYTFFGDNRFFAESKSVWGAEKLGVFYNETDMLGMENGYSVVTTAGQVIELPFVFGCTAYTNQFGYIYFKVEDEANIDPIALKHYVLIDDGRPAKNIYRGEWETGTAVAGEHNGAANDWYYTYPMPRQNGNRNVSIAGTYPERDVTPTCYCSKEQKTGIYADVNPMHLNNCYFPADEYAFVSQQTMTGTTYRPMFFGEDGNASQGSYEWPEGYKIVFWINTLSTSNGDNDLVVNHPKSCFTSDGGMGGHFNYSLPTLNKRLGHDYQGTLGSNHDLNTFGQVQTISWTIDGVHFLAFGDVSTDKDLNDMVFMISAPNANPGGTVEVASVKWHLNYSAMHEENDLFENNVLKVGSDYTNPKKKDSSNSIVDAEPARKGYTFVGWSTDPTATTGSKTISGTIPNTSTIHYYAIWEPTGDVVKIRWHLNYDGSHNVKHNGESGHDVYASNTVEKNVGKYSKPATDPSYSDATKVFKGWAATPTINDDSELLSNEALTNVTAGTEDKCYYAIWGPAPSPSGDPEPISWIFACEDLGGTFDYDFNDVVWEVKYAAGSTNVEVRLLAAGGTLPFTLNFNSQKVYTKEEAFGSSTKVEIKPNPTAWKKFTVANTWSLWSNRQEFVVAVEGNEGTSYISAYSKNDAQGATNTKTPEVIILPETWRWPLESVKISTAYPGFTTWVSNNNYVEWPTPEVDTTVTR